MNTATAIKRWVTPVPEQKTEVRTYSRKNQETATNESLWKPARKHPEQKVVIELLRIFPSARHYELGFGFCHASGYAERRVVNLLR